MNIPDTVVPDVKTAASEEVVELGGKEYTLRDFGGGKYVYEGPEGKEYSCKAQPTVTGPQDVQCECPGSTYRGTCKHQQYLVNKLQVEPKKRHPAETVKVLVDQLDANIFKGLDYDIAGSYRRGRPDQKDLDTLVKGNHFAEVKERLQDMYPGGDEARPGDRVRPAGSGGGGTGTILRWYVPIGTEGDEIELDFHFVHDVSMYGAKLLFFTGSKNFNIMMRGKAKGMGMALSDRGLFDRETKELITADEREIFEKIGIPWVPPNKRD